MPVTVEIPKETFSGKIREVTLGATKEQGGTRKRTVTVGGETTLPFLHFEGEIPNPPAIAVEITDKFPADWSPLLIQAWGENVMSDPALWAAKAEEAGADIIMIRLTGLDSNGQPYPPQEAATIVQRVLEATGLPLIVRGPGQPERDNELLTAVADKTAGERIALGLCEDKNYRTIVAAALANNHLVIASTPIDVNLAKQLNILISDMNMPLDRVLMDPTTGALGYGLEYTYSVMERLRIAALQGDPMVQLPMICFAGEESWRQKESKVSEGVPEAWGDWERRAILWEAITATTLLHAGADIVSLRHPKTIALVKQEIQKLMNKP